MTTPLAESATVPPTFTSNNPADCILKSSDGLQFYVLRGILIFASEVFRDMFSIPTPNTETEPGQLPVIEMAESGQVLSALLSVIYPVVPPRISEVSLAVGLLQAWKKYLMPMERLQPFLAELFSESSLLENPLDIYALAWKLDSTTEAKRASRYTHGVELTAEAMSRLTMLSGTEASLSTLIDLRGSRKILLKLIAFAVPIRQFACPNHGGGDNDVYDITAYIFHLLEMENQVEKALARPHFEACHDFRDFLALRTDDWRWPGSRLSKRCSHPTNNYCFGNIEPDQIEYFSAIINSWKDMLPMEITWPR